MRKIREILRLAWSCGQTRSSIAKSCGVGKTKVSDTLSRALAAKLSWPLPDDMGDDTLESLLYRSRNTPYKLSTLYPPPTCPTNRGHL